MSIAFLVQSNIQVGGGGTATTGAIDTTGASLIVICFGNFAGTVSSLTDSKSNTWTPVTNYVQGNQNLEIFYCKAPIVGTGHTFSGIGNYANIRVSAWSGTDITSPLEQNAGAGQASSTTVQPSSVTPLQANELIISAASSNASAGWTINGGFTLLGSYTNAGQGVQDAYLIQTTATAANPTWTAGSAIEQIACIASFKILASGTSWTKSLTETYTLTENFKKSTTRQLGDTYTLTEVIAKLTRRSISDVFTLVEVISKRTGKSLSDILTLVEFFRTSAPKTLLLSESFSIIEQFAGIISRKDWSYIRNHLSDPLSISSSGNAMAEIINSYEDLDYLKKYL